MAPSKKWAKVSLDAPAIDRLRRGCFVREVLRGKVIVEHLAHGGRLPDGLLAAEWIAATRERPGGSPPPSPAPCLASTRHAARW